MNYSLNLNLTGADQIDATLDRLLDKVGKVGTGQKVSFDDFLTTGLGEDAGEKMGESIGKGIAKGGDKAYQAWLKKAANETERLAKALTGGKWNYTAPDHQKEWYERGMPGMQGPDLNGAMREKANRYRGPKPPTFDDVREDREKFMANMSMISGPLMNPGSPLMTMFAGRQVFKALTSDTGQGMIGKFGLSGSGGAAVGAVALIGAATAIGFAFKGLERIVKEVAGAYETARKIYAKSLISGLGINLTIKRGQLAEIMGVSEQDVIKFGAAMVYLNPKLESSIYYLEKTTLNLTSVSWEFKVLGENLKGLFAVMANDAAPALRKFADGLSTVVKGATGMADSVGSFIQQHPWLAKAINAGIGLGSYSVSPAAGVAGSIISILSGIGKDSGPAPGISGRMNQLSASSWEKMGLVIGGGGTNTTNELIRKSNQYLAKIANYAAMPRANQGLGMDSSTGNP